MQIVGCPWDALGCREELQMVGGEEGKLLYKYMPSSDEDLQKMNTSTSSSLPLTGGGGGGDAEARVLCLRVRLSPGISLVA